MTKFIFFVGGGRDEMPENAGGGASFETGGEFGGQVSKRLS
jgi:hypothetical protein